MRAIQNSFLCLFICLLLASCGDDDMDMSIITNSQQDSLATLVLTINNIQDLEGTMHIGLYSSEEDWDEDVPDSETGSAFSLLLHAIEDSIMTVIYEDLDAGDYAFTIYQDIDDDGELDVLSDLIPLPQEPYGFSNNFEPKFSAPDFSDTSFEINYFDSLTVDINLIQP